jgi:hypothetical protein
LLFQKHDYSSGFTFFREQGTGNREQEMERIFPITND